MFVVSLQGTPTFWPESNRNFCHRVLLFRWKVTTLEIQHIEINARIVQLAKTWALTHLLTCQSFLRLTLLLCFYKLSVNLVHIVPLKGKLTVPWSSILETGFLILNSQKLWGSRLESSFETFEAFRKFIETVWEFIEKSFKTLELEKQRTFHAINFWHIWWAPAWHLHTNLCKCG